MAKPSFTTFQSIVALLAGLTSIVGAAYSAVGTLRPAVLPPSGGITVVVRDGARGDAVPGALVEVLTTDDAILTTLAHADGGVARGSVPPGDYRVRVTHPEFVDVVRDVRVVPDGTAELEFALARRPPHQASHATRGATAHATPGAVVDRSIANGRRLLGRLGF